MLEGMEAEGQCSTGTTIVPLLSSVARGCEHHWVESSASLRVQCPEKREWLSAGRASAKRLRTPHQEGRALELGRDMAMGGPSGAIFSTRAPSLAFPRSRAIMRSSADGMCTYHGAAGEFKSSVKLVTQTSFWDFKLVQRINRWHVVSWMKQRVKQRVKGQKQARFR